MSIEQQGSQKTNRQHHRPERWSKRGKLILPPPPEHQFKNTAERPRGWKKYAVGVVALASAIGVGAAVNARGGGEEAPEKAPEQTLVLGPDGEPLQYVEYSEEHSDRDHDGLDDSRTDDNHNGLGDEHELWDQTTNEFVVPGLDEDAKILETATQEELSNIAEIEATFGENWWGTNPHWKADFVQLDPLVQRRVMLSVRHPEDIGEGQDGHETNWQADVMFQFTRTPEDIRDS